MTIEISKKKVVIKSNKRKLLRFKRRNIMEKQLISKEEGIGELTTVNIPDEIIEEIISIGGDSVMWSKLVDGGFLINEKTIPAIEGIIFRIHPYMVRWDNKRPHKIPNIPNDEVIPEGYERRVDLKVLVDGQLLGLSLSKSSIKFQLSPYLRYLKNSGLRPEDVVTRLKSKQVSNVHGTFNVVVFEMLGTAKNITVKKVEPLEPLSGAGQETRPDVPPCTAEQEAPSAIPPEWA